MTSPHVAEPAVAAPAAAWHDHLSAEDRAVVTAAGYGKETPLGSRPALVLVDFQHAYLGADRPILDQLDAWPSGGGAGAWDALRATLPVIRAAREAGIPVIASRIGYPARDAASNPFAAKRGNGAGFVLGTPGTELAAELDRSAVGTVLTKTAASVFYGTELDRLLTGHGIDTLLVAGLSTSGCVRATVVDAAARGYRVAVMADCVADRIRASHDMALFDIWLKYGSVRPADEVLAYLAGLAAAESG